MRPSNEYIPYLDDVKHKTTLPKLDTYDFSDAPRYNPLFHCLHTSYLAALPSGGFALSFLVWRQMLMHSMHKVMLSLSSNLHTCLFHVLSQLRHTPPLQASANCLPDFCIHELFLLGICGPALFEPLQDRVLHVARGGGRQRSAQTRGLAVAVQRAPAAAFRRRTGGI
ncbi:unnamed protein product [Chondrus crispus]|uniref:Uncharacterized protein n=1 Tax=Chondrus crispus TaxID=2769 RepID=R7QIX9_CHOCR|nr:unnamed protein product [Chondrus crispus]CDF37380.1 unnamed protein product [Chondrus crispus]|eukprot:XP_005717199.1 unnamed protein product [Chondrus crispus]